MQGRLLSKKKPSMKWRSLCIKTIESFVFKVKNTIKLLYHTQQFEPLYFKFVLNTSFLMYTGGRLAIYHKNKYLVYWRKKNVNISYSNFFHCLSLKSPLKLFYHSFHTLVSRECRDILSYARQIPNAKKENIKAVFTVFILLFHCYSKLLGRSKQNSFSKWYTC